MRWRPGTIVDDESTASLTASFQEVPVEHEGKGNEFSFELRFSENFLGRLPYKKLRDEALRATNGRVTGARSAGAEPALDHQGAAVVG